MTESSRPSDIASCLILHGLGGGPYEVAPLIEALTQAGVRAHAPILPGHEGPGPVMPASRWEDWAATSEAAFDELSAQGGPVGVLGFSTGSTLALRLASHRPVARMVLLAPFLAIRYSRLFPIRPASYLRQIARVLPNLPRRPAAVRDPRVRRSLKGVSPFRTFSLPATLSALELIEQVKPTVPAITAPTLILQGARDTVVEPTNATWLHRYLGATNKRICYLPLSDHLVALDFDRDRVAEETLAFLLDTTNSPR